MEKKNNKIPRGVKRSPLEKEEIKQIISCLYVRGFRTYEVLDYLHSEGYNLSPTTIYNYINQIKEDWKELRKDEITKVVTEQLTKIDAIELEAWKAWGKSQEEGIKIVEKKTGANSEKKTKTKGHNILETTITRTSNAGEYQFLRIIKECIETRVELLTKLNFAPMEDKDKPKDLSQLIIKISKNEYE